MMVSLQTLSNFSLWGACFQDALSPGEKSNEAARGEETGTRSCNLQKPWVETNQMPGKRERRRRERGGGDRYEDVVKRRTEGWRRRRTEQQTVVWVEVQQRVCDVAVTLSHQHRGRVYLFWRGWQREDALFLSLVC